jgi:predicted murein hydrolase (TIGR00659 family)
MLMITLFSILITISVYKFTLYLGKKYSSPFTNSVFLSTVIIITLLLVSNLSYQDYTPAKNLMTYLLGPATVALAVPIYKNRGLIARFMSAAIIGIFAGTLTTITTAILLAKWFHFSRDILLSLSVKSVTTPIAIGVGNSIKGNIPLIAGFVMITGMIGAMFGSKILNWIKVDHPFARGLSIGTIAHGIGTSEAVKEGEIQGAVAGAAMGIAGVLTSVVIPYLIPYFI